MQSESLDLLQGTLDPEIPMRDAPYARRLTSAGVALFLFASATGSVLAQTPATEPLTVRDVLGLAEFTDRNQVDLSPDGTLVAFSVQDPWRAAAAGGARYFDEHGVPQGHQASDVYVTDLRSGATRRLSDGRGSSWGPVWSPDGRTLAFYSDRDGLARVWLWNRSEDRISRLSDGVVRPFFGFEQIAWAPDGSELLVKLVPEGMSFAELERLYPAEPAASPEAAEGAGVTARVFAYAPADAAAAQADAPAPPVPDLDSTRSFLNAELSDLAVVEVPSGRVRRIGRRVRAIGYRFAPDGNRVAFSTRQPDGGTGMLVYDRYDLWVVDAAGGAVRALAPKTVQEYGLGFSWSPDGERIAYETDGTVKVVDVQDAAPVREFSAEGLSLGHVYRPPLWTDDRTLIVAAGGSLRRLSLETGEVTEAARPRDRRLVEIVVPADAQHLIDPRVTVLVSDEQSERMGFQILDLKTGQATALFERDLSLDGSGYRLDTSEDDRLVFVAQSGARPPDVWVAGGRTAEPRRVTDLHPRITGMVLGESRLIQWTGPGGRLLQGALLLPAGYAPGARVPLVVKVYGGSLLSRTVNRFGLEAGVDNLQLLATRGYAVLLPDTPAQEGTPMADIAAAVLPALDSLVTMGIADPERLAVMGHSYGGYSALAVAVQSPRFRAVISSAGFSNLFGQYTEMREDGSVVGIAWSEQGQGRMGGHPWEHRERYLRNSPFFFLDRIEAPVLLLHGGSDSTVLPQRAHETYVGLRRLGNPVTLVQYEGEEHHPGTWSIENATDYWERIFDWLGRHLAPLAPRIGHRP